MKNGRCRGRFLSFFFRLKKEVVDKLELGMVARSGQDSPFKEPFAQIVV